MRSKRLLLRVLIALLVAALFCVVVRLGWLDAMDGTVSDALYQHERPTDGEVLVIGMDQRSVDAFGPMPWPRDIMADVIGILNSDPDNMPAVIGIDVLYVGGSADPDADAYLAEIAAEGGNVVAASAALFGSELVDNGDSFYMDTRAVLGWDAPYPDLADVTGTGHINAMADGDGILRHGLLYIDTPEHGRVYSFSRVIYERYCAAHGLAVNPMPPTRDNGFFYIPFSAKGNTY